MSSHIACDLSAFWHAQHSHCRELPAPPTPICTSAPVTIIRNIIPDYIIQDIDFCTACNTPAAIINDRGVRVCTLCATIHGLELSYEVVSHVDRDTGRTDEEERRLATKKRKRTAVSSGSTGANDIKLQTKIMQHIERTEALYEKTCQPPVSERDAWAERLYSHLQTIWDTLFKSDTIPADVTSKLKQLTAHVTTHAPCIYKGSKHKEGDMLTAVMVIFELLLQFPLFASRVDMIFFDLQFQMDKDQYFKRRKQVREVLAVNNAADDEYSLAFREIAVYAKQIFKGLPLRPGLEDRLEIQLALFRTHDLTSYDTKLRSLVTTAAALVYFSLESLGPVMYGAGGKLKKVSIDNITAVSGVSKSTLHAITAKKTRGTRFTLIP